jgi:hypothetical protein
MMKKRSYRQYRIFIAATLWVICAGMNSCRKSNDNPVEPQSNKCVYDKKGKEFEGHIWHYTGPSERCDADNFYDQVVGESWLSCDALCADHGGCDESGFAYMKSQTCQTLLEMFQVPDRENVAWIRISLDEAQTAGLGCGFADQDYYPFMPFFISPASCSADENYTDAYYIKNGFWRVCPCKY